jgi:hypothetical protein
VAAALAGLVGVLQSFHNKSLRGGVHSLIQEGLKGARQQRVSTARSKQPSFVGFWLLLAAAGAMLHASSSSHGREVIKAGRRGGGERPTDRPVQ